MAYTRKSKRASDKTEKSQTGQQQVQLLNSILSATTEFIHMFDKQGRYLFTSESAAKVLGHKQSDFIGKTWQEIGLPAEFMQPFEVHRQNVMATGQIVRVETLFPLTNGMRWLEYVASPVLDAHGEVESVVVAAKDITERKQAEEAVYRLASMVESSGDAILSKTLQGVITSWNSGAETLYGYTADEIIGKSISLLVPPDRQNEILEILALIAVGETVKNHETIRVRKDGKHRDMSLTISPIRDATGKIIGASAIAHDITEQKLLTEELAVRSHELEGINQELSQQRNELAALNSDLEEANRIRSQFLSTMSHELRTPLASIIGFSQISLDGAEKATMSQRQSSNLKRILSNAQHLLDLINDVLDLTKIEAGRMVINYSQVDVKELLTSVVEETESIAFMRNLVLSVEVEDGADFFESNPVKLHQILLNLISNALKFTEQGEVKVSARRVVVSPDGELDRLALAVHDSGIGIPSDIQEHIFEPFYQVDGSYTRKASGTGLGLSIVSRLTTLLGGTIEVISAPGQGSTFTVLLPIKAVSHYVEQDIPRLLSPHFQEIPSLPSSSPELASTMLEEIFTVSPLQEAPGGQNNVVLTVDDNPDILVLINAALKDTSYTVVGLQDPSQAMDLVQELQPCAIILDVMMPGVNGWQLLYQLKANPDTASIPVVMLSVLAEPTTGYVLGAEAYLVKPFHTEVLLTTLQRVITAQQDAAQVGKRETQPA